MTMSLVPHSTNPNPPISAYCCKLVVVGKSEELKLKFELWYISLLLTDTKLAALG